MLLFRHRRRLLSTLPSSSPPLLDRFGRFHDYLRISLTERCNLRCTYCMPTDGVTLSPADSILTSEEIIRTVGIFARLGVTKIRLTGGEPTLRKDLVPICASISKMPGIRTLAITTNGLLLTRLGRALRQEGGVNCVNISLDTLHKERFQSLTLRNGHGLVMDGIAHALDLGFDTVKLNCVVKRGVNEHELVPMALMTKHHAVQVRFLEHMPFSQNEWTDNSVVPYKEMLSMLQQHFGAANVQPVGSSTAEVAKVWRIAGHRGEIGFITAMSSHFCGTCNRLRLTSDGSVKSCLFGEQEFSLRDALRQSDGDDDRVIDLIRQAVWAKHEKLGGHADPQAISHGKNRPMILIGAVLTHFENGKPKMVDVSNKTSTHRFAHARAIVRLPAEACAAAAMAGAGVDNKKGSPLQVAILGGIMAAKQTSTLIPLCHPIPLQSVDVDCELLEKDGVVQVDCRVKAFHHTGVEMEALTGATVASLVVYDMLKAASHGITIESVHLVAKTGGKRDFQV